ncbi:hypothetical protein H0H92_002039 [Tricholoma furcatifolium]|nr:hypothetical protein H0H92_002039 [Tricholoma furcatifolium]
MDNMSALIKLPCVLAVSTALHIAHTSPGKSSVEERTQVDGFLENVVKFGTRLIQYVKAIYWSVGIVEMASILSAVLAPGSKIASLFVKSGGSDMSRLHLTPLSALGLFLIVFGTWLRMECYSAMKNLFTFEVSIRKDHKLVTTWPYNVVRHPSYSGMLAIHVGMYCWFGSQGP